MSKTRQISKLSSGNTQALSTTTNAPIGDCTLVFQATEANAQTISRTLGVYSQLYAEISANASSGNCTVKFRKASANGNQSVTIGAGATGTFTDETNTDSVGATDKVNVQVITGAGGSITFRAIGLSFQQSGNTTKRLAGTGPFTTTTASTTFFSALGGVFNSGIAESANQLKCLTPCTIRSLMVNVTAASAQATTVRSRKNSANGGLSLSFTATGQFEDSTDFDALASGDTFGISVTTGTGTSTRTMTYLGVDYTTTNNRFILAGNAGPPQTFAAGGSAGFAVGDGTIVAEPSATILADMELIVRNTVINITANTLSNSAFFAVRRNSATTVTLVTVGAGLTGFFQDTVDTALFAPGDTLDFVGTSSAGGTSISFGPYSTEVEVSTMPENAAKYPDYLDNPIQVEAY